MRYLAAEYDVSIVVGKNLESETITAEFVDASVSQALDHLAKRIGAEVRYQNGIYYIGELSKEDRGVLVRRVRRLSGEELLAALRVVSSDTGSVATFEDGLVVISDTVSVLDRAESLLDQIERAGQPGWVVQLQVISYGVRSAKEFGVDLVPAGTLAATIAGNASIEIAARLDGVLKLAKDCADVELIADPLLLLGDGRDAKFQRIEQVPYRTEVVLDRGGSLLTQTSIEFLDVGFHALVKLRETSDDRALITVDVKNSVVTAVNGDLPPTVSADSFTSVVPVKAGGLYLVGAFEARESRRASSIGFPFSIVNSSETRIYQVWLRTYRVGEMLRPVEERSAGTSTAPENTAEE